MITPFVVLILLLKRQYKNVYIFRYTPFLVVLTEDTILAKQEWNAYFKEVILQPFFRPFKQKTASRGHSQTQACISLIVGM